MADALEPSCGHGRETRAGGGTSRWGQLVEHLRLQPHLVSVEWGVVGNDGLFVVGPFVPVTWTNTRAMLSRR